MAAHARRSSSPAQRALLRAGLLATVAGAALGAGVSAASAATPVDPGAVEFDPGNAPGAKELAEGVAGAGTGVGTALDGGLGAVKELQLNPLANTGVDPLDNGLGTKIADFHEVSTRVVTEPLARGASLDELPAVGPVTESLPG